MRSPATKLEDIEKAIAGLPIKDLAKLRVWLEEFEGRQLDRRIERDVRAGRDAKLAKLAPRLWRITKPAAVAGCDPAPMTTTSA